MMVNPLQSMLSFKTLVFLEQMYFKENRCNRIAGDRKADTKNIKSVKKTHMRITTTPAVSPQ